MYGKAIILSISCALIAGVSIAQHPNFDKIDSLKKILPLKKGVQRVDCLNAISEEYWWPLTHASGIISGYAIAALQEARSIHYDSGIAEATMLLGVAEILGRDFIRAQINLQDALDRFEALHSDFGLGWSYVWLGQAFYYTDRFEEALASQNKSLFYFEKLGDWEGQGKAWAWIGMTYATLGNYDSSFYFSTKSLNIRQKMSDHACVVMSFINMGHLYNAAGSFSDAVDYYNQGIQYASKHNLNGFSISWTYFDLIGNIYRRKKYADSSYLVLQKSLRIDPAQEMTKIGLGETLLMKNEYDSALQIFLSPIDTFRKGNDRWDLMRVLTDASKAYMGKGDDKKALWYAQETYSIAKKAQTTLFILNDYQLLSELYYRLHFYDSAYLYSEKYAALNDSINNQQFLWKLANYKEKAEFKNKMEQVQMLDRENKAKEEQLKEEARQKWILIAFLLVSLLSGIVLYKNLSLKRKNEALESKGKQAELQHHVTNLEMQALRAQMNPHFIFNCLSSINRFILINETESASNYLTKFSKLIRTVLNNSKKSLISLEDELDMLRLYLDLEKLRFKDSFDYSITFVNSIDDGNVFVPPLLLQPFAENAIWHGLMHKEGLGKLEIELRKDDQVLTCTITDNGIGRKKAAEFRSKFAEKQKSLGLHITKERLAMLNEGSSGETFLHIEDLYDKEGRPSGTRVTLKMIYKNLTEVVLET